MAPARHKAEHPSSINHTTKIIHHLHHPRHQHAIKRVFFILDKEYFNTYVKIDIKSDKKVFSKSNRLKCLKEKEHDYLIHYQWESSNFYVMPKINN